jgi:hypothetical protein
MNSPETKTIQHLLGEFKKIQDLIPKPDRGPTTPRKTSQKTTSEIERLLELLKSDWFVSVAGYFINHRSSSSYVKIDDENKVQDLMYCLALSVVPDLQYEDPQQKNTGALTSTRVDFFSTKNKLFIEIKLANSSHTAKKIETEISEDIVKYGKQHVFNTLIFFIYCNEYSFPNPREFEKGFTGLHSIQEHHFKTYCIIKP